MDFASPRQYFGPKQVRDASAFDALDFSGVSMRCFFLRANQVQLQRFCDNYLNLAPREMAYFEPLGPFVVFQALNYGRMSPVASNLGWVAQHEVLFGVPVRGRWHEGGKVVEGVASVSPFIFVDNDWSVVTGREIYGWPKYPARIVPEVNPWMEDPREARRLLTLETFLFPRLYASQPLQRLILLELVQKAPQFAQLPLDAEYLLDPFLQFPKALFDSASMVPDLLQGMARAWFSPDASSPEGLLRQASESLLTMPPELFFNTINLKQFRSSDPDVVAYQSLVNGRLQVTRLNAGGLLGSVEMLRGDPTGGFTLLVHEYPDFPIIEALGLEVDRRVQTQGVEVAALRPLLPCWASLDLRYKTGTRLCWRTRSTSWAVGSERPPEPPGAPPRFNTALGPVVEALEGPFEFFDATARVLPLRAKPQRDPEEREQKRRELGLPEIEIPPSFETMLEERLGPPLKDLFEPLLGRLVSEGVPLEVKVKVKLLPWVFLSSWNFGKMSNTANDLGWWGGRYVDLVTVAKLKVQIEIPGDEVFKLKELETHFLLTPYAFADTPIAVTAGREILGLPTAFARISGGLDPWIDSDKALIDRSLMHVTVRDYPAVGVGQGSAERMLFEVRRKAPEGGTGSSAGGLISNVQDYLKPLKNGVRLSNLSLKQFRDEEDPSLVCYRSLVAWEQILYKLEGPEEGAAIEISPLDGDHQVLFHELPSWPLVQSLGLEAEWRTSDEGAPIAVCKVESPYWLKVDLRSNLPIALTRQSVDGEWRTGVGGTDYLLWRLRRGLELMFDDLQLTLAKFFNLGIPLTDQEEQELTLGDVIDEDVAKFMVAQQVDGRASREVKTLDEIVKVVQAMAAG